MRGIGMEKVNLISVMGSKQGPTIILTAPRQDDEHCSITLEPIGEPPASLQFIPLSRNPLLTCAEMEVCGHRFNAMALIAHFAKNSMTCPMCRAGLAKNRMDVCASFPNEPWTALALLAKPQSLSTWPYGDYLITEDNDVEDEGYLIGGLDSGISTPPTSFSMTIPLDVREMSMFVVFLMYRNPEPERQDSNNNNNENNNNGDFEGPCIRLQCPLVWNHILGAYELSVTSRRQVSTIINEMRVHSIAASIFARHARLYDEFGTFPLSCMGMTRLSSDMIVELVNSMVDSPGAQPLPNLKISVHMGSVGSDNRTEVNMSEFVFTPPQMAYIRRLLVEGG